MNAINKIENLEEWSPEKFIDFDVISENWYIYELEDKTIIRFKTVLTAIYDAVPAESETAVDGLRKAFFNMRLLSSVFSPKDIREKKGKVWSILELEKNIAHRNLMFRQLKDAGFAEYETAKSKLQIKTILKQVDKTSKFDALGNPAYIIRTENEVFVERKQILQEQTKSEE